ncbi:hypothetical protein, partial [Anabaena sp. UHCC 0253]|uniref:hypothetical protein n=1 Tax=Anabaena sp. UHCC 0253 TaxID=2590019 RepID=UPI0020C28A9E
PLTSAECGLEQHPKLFAAITQRGGVEWLENCTHYVTSARDNYWEGKGKESPFIRALIEGYSRVLENSQTITQVSSELPAKESVPKTIKFIHTSTSRFCPRNY